LYWAAAVPVTRAAAVHPVAPAVYPPATGRPPHVHRRSTGNLQNAVMRNSHRRPFKRPPAAKSGASRAAESRIPIGMEARERAGGWARLLDQFGDGGADREALAEFLAGLQGDPVRRVDPPRARSRLFGRGLSRRAAAGTAR
jgi:hypothetical protein